MNWTLTYRNTTQPLHAWGLSQLKRKCINQACDQVSFTHIQEQLHKPLFQPESCIRIQRDDHPWFTGLITQVPAIASALEEKQVYTAQGPWWYLKSIVYQQPWTEVSDWHAQDTPLEERYKSRVILGQSPEGNLLSINDQLHEILTYAIKQGALLSIGHVDVDGTAPFMEAKDLSCSEAIQRLLRWAPTTVTWFDYAQETPILNIVKRSQLTTTRVTFKDPVKQFKVTPRYDLQVPAVVLKYEKLHRCEGQLWSSTHTDRYPLTATGSELKALVLTLEMQGTQCTTLQQSVKTQPIQVNSLAWWKAHIPELSAIPDSQLEIKDIQRSCDLSEELIEGAIAPWMDRQAFQDTILAKVSYETQHESVIDREMCIRLTATDALSKTYTHTLSSSQEEPIPQGLAQALFNALHPLQYEGSLTLEDEEVSSFSFLGTQINMSELYTAEGSILGLAQEVKEDVDKGQTVILFGPPKHLGPSDLAELLRMNRERETASSAWVRLKGQANNTTSIIQPTHTRLDSTTSGSSQYKRLTFNQPGTNRKIVIDADTIKHDVEVGLREEFIAINGELKRRYTLCSDGY